MSCPQYILDELFPVKIFHNDYYLPFKLNANEKLYIGLYANANGDIQKVDLVMLDMVSNRCISSIKKHLSELGLIRVSHKYTPEDAKAFTIDNSHKGLVCEWCGRQCYTLHKHHYPILASSGGKQTVSICPNCHYTYHSIIKEEEE